MSRKTFKGGVHPPSLKEPIRDNSIKSLKLPKEVVIPLIQHAGAPCVPTVKIGDEVKAGTLIGNSEKFISSAVHSSISGKVKAIRKSFHPVIGRCDSIIIESDARNEREPAAWDKKDSIDSLNADDIIDIIRKAGIVGLGGAAFPTHIKLSPPKEKPIDTFILNGAECEPYLTCDERVMIEKPKQVLSGTLLIMKALGVKKGFVAIEDNKPQAIKAMRDTISTIHHPLFTIHIVVLPTKYPQGSEKQIISAILKREVPTGGLPFDVGCVVDNIQTALAVHEAIYEAKPLYERVITVAGDAIKEPSNLLVKIGTPLSYIIESCSGLIKPLSKVIVGGPMMGIAQYSMDIPVIKGTSGIILISRESAFHAEEQVCIRCGRCVSICPMRLMPTTLVHLVKKERFNEAKEFGITHCFECGACAYDCPAKIPLLDYLKYGKSKA